MACNHSLALLRGKRRKPQTITHTHQDPTRLAMRNLEEGSCPKGLPFILRFEANSNFAIEGSARARRTGPAAARSNGDSSKVSFFLQTNLIRNEVINVLSDWGKISGRTLQELSTGDVSLLMRQIVKRKRNIEVNQERLKQLSERLQSFAKTQFKSPLDSNPSALLPWSNTQEGDEKGSHGPATSSPNRIPAGNRRELAAIGTRARIAAAHLEQYAASQSSPSLAICMAYWKAGLERSPLTSLNAIIEWIETRHSREKMRVRRLASDKRISSAGPDASGSVSVGKKKETNMEIEAVSDDVKTRSESRLAAGVLVELPNVCYVAILFDKPGQGKCVESIEASGWHEGPEAALQADPSRAMAFKSMSVQCAASLQQIKQALRAAKGLAVLSFLVDWLANYSTLFKTKCEWELIFVSKNKVSTVSR
eukprot:jgi/Bigna1/66795/fgenesh1_pg.2_\